MSDTILNDVKHLVGPSEECNYFDKDLLIHINSVFGTLFQIGVGADRTKPYFITAETTWDDITGGDARRNMVKQYVYMKTRLAFDPPSTSFVLDSLKQQIEELEWRMRMMEETQIFGGVAPAFDYDNYKYDESSKKWVDGDEA